MAHGPPALEQHHRDVGANFVRIAFLTRDPKLALNDNDVGKPEGNHLMAGRRPHIAFGRSLGDGARLSLLVSHDDAERE